MLKKTMMAVTLSATLLLSTGVAGAAPSNTNKGTQATTPYYVNELSLPFKALEGYETERYWGVHNGAGYRIEVPKDWNGELVLWAHGYRGTGLELTVDVPTIREHFIKKGFAWAASSYSTNGYDVAQGVKDTHALGSLFNGKIGKPNKTYITGQSMGGHITAVAAEQYGSAYAGALPMCGVTGDTELFDYFTDFGFVAQALGGIKKENQVFIADVKYFNETVPKIKEKLGIGKLLPASSLTPDGLVLKKVTMNLTGGERPLYDFAWGAYKDFLFEQMPVDPSYIVAPKNVVNTTDSVYQFDEDMNTLSKEEENLNESTLRIEAHPSSKQKGLTGIPKVQGTHSMPMISLHNIGDLFVPFHMQQLHVKRAIAQGNEDLLVTRVIRDVKHCGFTAEEQTEAFDDLVLWVEEGVIPDGDDVLDPANVADNTFGTKFTSELRGYDPLKDK
ncbi:pimeloyl-ACP methyl ester carboxylesterase [Bacillus mesophilus]|uniref:Alpha/beta hydrolase n=1 Tax=Bacillus mesophilus TaxID=1808955 RepID=A0A6M0QBF7_9BACI|nr:hypothetical protein [Bacillus mesophilus]MBM7663013.1 pimeloyl-ACP methyl ester carboxylesterase [Bacillus mesophilus]NEY73665.1 hypothetical protein [Bacillus mesophilus]